MARRGCSGGIGFEDSTLDAFLRTATLVELEQFVGRCQTRCVELGTPQLFDGVGRPYKPRKALYFMLSWLIRDAPQQRLQPLLADLKRHGMDADEAERRALSRLFFAYRDHVGTFEWVAVREVVADRLEGSRRSLRGRMAEAGVRSVVAEALADVLAKQGSYGRFTNATMSAGEVLINGHAFDVCVDFSGPGVADERLVLPVKTRETQGGGHANLFSRDIEAAMGALRDHSQSTGVRAWLVPVIIAENWHADQVAQVRAVADSVILVDGNPNAMEGLPDGAAADLSAIVTKILGDTSSQFRAPVRTLR